MDPQVETSYGPVRGTSEHGVEVYRGIPYAAPPTGARRFRAPEPPEAWDGVLDGTQFGHAALQHDPTAPAPVFIHHTSPPEAEDCLTLNVWTPGADGRRRPVMVWIHGGSFVIGAGSEPLYDGAALALGGDVVVVTINYRLGLFGFLQLDSVLEDGGLTGNQGLLDQVAALRWVHHEIAAFGGDPTNVTVFGESAGAMSIAAMLAMPDTKGLFQKAILQSGAANMFLSQEAAATTTELILRDLGLAPSQAAQLWSRPAEELLAVQYRATPRKGRGSFAPVRDGVILPLDPLAAIGEGSASGVSIMIGTNEDEMGYFHAQDPRLATLTMEELHELVRTSTGEELDPEHVEGIIETYRTAREERGVDASPPALWTAIATDWVFRVPSLRLAEAHARHTSVYAYLFDWKSPAAGGRVGAGHFAEVPFVFGTYTDPGVARLELDQPGAADLAAAIQDAWARFARFGSPATPLLPEWLPYEPSLRWTMRLGAQSATVNGPADAERAVWEHGPALPAI